MTEEVTTPITRNLTGFIHEHKGNASPPPHTMGSDTMGSLKNKYNLSGAGKPEIITRLRNELVPFSINVTLSVHSHMEQPAWENARNYNAM